MSWFPIEISWLSKIEFRTLVLWAFFIIAISGMAIGYLGQKDAAFYCQAYCNASGSEFRGYSSGSCRCNPSPAPVFDIKNLTFLPPE